MARSAHRGSKWRALLERLRRWRRSHPESPEDPYAYRMAPLRTGPKGRSGAAAVAESEEHTK